MRMEDFELIMTYRYKKYQQLIDIPEAHLQGFFQPILDTHYILQQIIYTINVN